MRTRSYAVVAVAASGIMAMGLLTAPAASAYPPGKAQKTVLNRTDVRSEGRFKAEVRNAEPGCRVRFAIVDRNGREVDSRTGTVARDGTTEREFSPAPTREGTYTVTATVSGGGCLTERSSATLTVRPR